MDAARFRGLRAAWEGPLTDHPDIRIRIEAAAYQGRPVSMLIVGPWLRPFRMQAESRTTSQVVLSAFVVLIAVALVIAALLLARHNLRAQRADRRGATRLALFVMIGYAVSWVLAAHHVPDVPAEVGGFMRSFGAVLLAAAVLWLIYLALEPYVRRFWPDGILGWTRLMSGHVRDPRVGHDVMLGCLFAVGAALLTALSHLVPPLLGLPSTTPLFQANVAALSGPAMLVSILFDVCVGGIFSAMFAALAYVLLRLALGRPSWAIAAAFLLLSMYRART